MSDLDDHDGKHRVFDRVDDPVVALTDAIPILAGKFFAPWRSWVGAQLLDSGGYSPTVLGWQRFEFLCS